MGPQIEKSLDQSTDQNMNYANGVSVKDISKTAITWSCTIKNFNSHLTNFWRRYGVKVSFLYTFFIVWYGVVTTVVDYDPNSNSDQFTALQTFWLTAWRIVALFVINFTLPGLISLFLYTVPEIGSEDAESLPARDPVKLVLRIVTRGDYPKLIKDNVDYHENLFKSHWRCDDDQIEIHVVTETPLEMSRPRRNGLWHRCEVKEYDIPKNYVTPNKTLYKARNNTFALQQCLNEAQANKESLDHVWSISIDEDVFLTQAWLKEFNSTVLHCNEYKLVNSPSRPIFLDENLGMNDGSSMPSLVPFFGETFRLAMDISRVWWQAKLFGRCGVGIRGSCYAVRMDVEARIGYDCGGPFLSIGDDTTFFHNLMMESDVKLRFMDAWFLEGAPNHALTFAKQRARWVRNYLYFLIFAKIPVINKLRLASFLVAWTVVLPSAMLIWVSGSIMFFGNGRIVDFFPAGPASPFMDTICCVSSACVMYWYIYGCALLLPWYLAVPIALTFSTYVPLIPFHMIASMAAVCGLLGGIHELATGAAEFGITEKKGN